MLLAISVAAAGPWVKSPGEAYVKASANVFRATEYVAPGVETSDLEYLGLTSSVYAEAGIAEGVQLVASVPWVSGRNLDTATGWAHRTSGFGDLRAGIGLDVPKLELPASLSVIARVPLYDQSELEELSPQIGDENVDLDAIAAVGGALPAGDHWIWLAAETGLRWRTGLSPSGADLDLDPGLPYRVQVGLAPRWGGWISVQGSGLVNLGSGADSKSWHQLGAGVAAPLVRGLHAEVGGARTYAAELSSLGWSAEAGLSWKR